MREQNCEPAAPAHAAETALWRWSGTGGLEPRPDFVAREEPLEVRVRGQSVAVTMRTPGHDEELAAGFLLTEGMVKTRADITAIAPCQQGEAALHGNILNVFLAPSADADLSRLTRHVFASSSCGVCGKASIEAVHVHFPAVESDFSPMPEMLIQLPERLRAAQAGFDATGGLHAAALFDAEGHLLVLREDVGRHNAVDKVTGRAFLDGLLPLRRHVLLVSGRVSFEIVQKALAAGIPVVAAISAPSSLAVEFAEASGQTLIGFLRNGNFNVYSHPERLRGKKQN